MTSREELPGFARNHQLGKLARRGENVTSEGDYEADTDFVDDAADAEVVLSITGKTRQVTAWGATYEEPLHRPILDVDFPVAVVPSTTPGHFHLYIDKELTWNQYQALLRGLADAGIIEMGYLQASEARQFTSVRMPSVKKVAS